MEHEHQNPFAGIKWHEEAVYESLSGPPNNWPRQTTFHNILEKLSPQQVQGSSWDPDSIMEYEFEPGLIDEPEQYDVNGLVPSGVLSKADKTWAAKWYPGTTPGPTVLEPFQSAAIDLAAGQQVDFVIRPQQSRRHTIATKGACDTLTSRCSRRSVGNRVTSPRTTTAARTATRASDTSSSRAAPTSSAFASTTPVKRERRR